MFFSYFYFFRKVCCKILKCNTKIGSISASVALFLSIQMAPSPAEAFFWWNGASYYVIFHSLALIFIINFIICVYEDQCSVKQWIGLSLLGIFIAGGNYITMLLAMELMGCAIVYSIYNRKTVTPKIIIIFLLSFVGFLVNCLSPGNAVRQSAYESWSPVKAILYSYHEAYLYIEEWTEPILVIALAFLFPFLWNAVTKNLETKIWEYLILFLIVVSLFASAFTPTLYAYGEAGPGRIQNIRYFLWILICILMELMVICLLKGIIEEYTTEYSVRKLTRAIYNRYALCFFGSILFCSIFAGLNYTIAEGENDFTTVSAVKSLMWGEARQYDSEVDARVTILEGDETKVYLQPYSSHPKLLFLIDIQEDPDNWINCAVAKFYKKEEVHLKN